MLPPAALVACNIYVTAAASQSSALMSLLRRAQNRCREIRKDDAAHNRCTSKGDSPEKETMATVAIIHAYADVPYDRSSFHLAGTPECVSDVATGLICNALKEIEMNCNNGGGSSEPGGGKESRHPFVGLVDHVSVMPLTCSGCDAAANAARQIGERVSEMKLVNVHYYGRACPNNTPLATVRREKTSFFKSGGAVDRENAKETSMAPKGDTTIGAPGTFVENFNVRLTTNVSFDQAKTLTQFLRGRNIDKGYGIAGVEALTLPYVRSPSEGGKVYEVACNLTKPKEGGADEIRTQLGKWIDTQTQLLSETSEGSGSHAFGYDYFVEDAYPVGTTEDQCKEVLSGKRFATPDEPSSNESFWEEYDDAVLRNFQRLLQH